MIRIGAHLSSAGSLTGALERADSIGANCIQIFVGSPRSWLGPNINPDQVDQFLVRSKQLDIAPVFIHAIYLIGLGSNNPVLTARSIESLINSLKVADKIGAIGVITHLGSSQGADFKLVLARLKSSIKTILSRAQTRARLIIENSAGQKNGIGSRLDQLAEILAIDPNLGLCLDSAHAFAAGLDLSGQKTLNELVEQIDRSIGLDRLLVIHVNDSKVGLAGRADRHENIGQGAIGLDAFGRMLNHPKLRGKPFILETPGFEPKHKGPDRRNVDLLKSVVRLK